MTLHDAIRELVGCIGLHGQEDDVRTWLVEQLRPLAAELRIDPLGNLIVTLPGQSGQCLLLDAHMDEVGFLVTFVEPAGFLRFGAVGGWDVRIVPGSRVLVRATNHQYYPGVIGALPPHVTRPEDRSQVIPLESLAVDVGATDAGQVAALGIEVGSAMVIDHGFGSLAGRRIYGRAFDDRVACAALLMALGELRGTVLPWTVVVCFSTGEERGLVGAGPAAYNVKPDLALCVETTTATDVLGVAPADEVAALGRGIAFTLADRTVTVPNWYFRALQHLAASQDIRYQVKKPLVGSTNASTIERAGRGCPTAIASVPARNIHSGVSVVDMDDVEQMVRFLIALAVQVDQVAEQMPRVAE